VYMDQVVFKHPGTVEASANQGENRSLEATCNARLHVNLWGKGNQEVSNQQFPELQTTYHTIPERITFSRSSLNVNHQQAASLHVAREKFQDRSHSGVTKAETPATNGLKMSQEPDHQLPRSCSQTSPDKTQQTPMISVNALPTISLNSGDM
jgi:hypothetical protein